MSGNAHTRRKARRAEARNFRWTIDTGTFITKAGATSPWGRPAKELMADLVKTCDEIYRRWPVTDAEREYISYRNIWKQHNFGMPGGML